MLTQADHDFINDLRRRGCAVVVFSPEEVANTGEDQWTLEEAVLGEAVRITDRWSAEHDTKLSPHELQAKHVDEHPEYPVDAWVGECAQLSSPTPYWDWVWLQLDNGRE